MRYSWPFLFILFLFSCTKKEPKLDKYDLLKMVLKFDSKAELVKPADMNAGIKCSDYGPGCKGGHMAKLLNLDVIFLEYNSVKSAKNEALRIDGYYLQNWVLDEFSGEPSLERFAEDKLKAIRARVEEPETLIIKKDKNISEDKNIREQKKN